MEIIEEIVQEARRLSEYIINMRREFHMYPELAYEEERTSNIVKNELDKLGFNTYRIAKTGVVGELKNRGRYTVALRADMDALPIQEENDISYKSRITGKMHACGHDAHTAMLLGAAHILSKLDNKLEVNIKLIFQPAEEGRLGAKKVVEEGGLNDVDAIFGLHVWAGLDSGLIGIKNGPLLASADFFKIFLKGMGGHGASPHEARDPIPLAADLVNAYQKIITREVDPLEPTVLSVTSIKAGTTFNVIPETLEMLGTIRTFNKEVRNYIVKRMTDITLKYADAIRCDASIDFMGEYNPPTINDSGLAEYARKMLRSLGNIVTPKPTMTAEDFSFYLEKTRGLFILLGIRNEKKGLIYPHHHPRFNVDENILWMGSAIHSILASQYREYFENG